MRFPGTSHTPPIRHWAYINEVTCVVGIRFLFWICRVFGRWPFRIFLYPILAWYVMTKPQARIASRNYLRQVAISSNSEQIEPGLGLVFRHFASFAESILDKLLLWSGLVKTKDVVFSGDQALVEYIDQKRGCLLVCAHFGNLELCKVLSRQRPQLKITMLVHTKHAKAFNRLLMQIDPESQLNLMQVTEMTPATAIILSEKIQQGEFVVIAGDRIPVSANPRVIMARFLGQEAPFPVGPYVLGSLLKCPVHLMFAMHSGQTSEIHFELFRQSIQLPHKRQERRDEILSELAADYAARLEHYCQRAPMQWFNFYDFWHLPIMDTSDAPR